MPHSKVTCYFNPFFSPSSYHHPQHVSRSVRGAPAMDPTTLILLVEPFALRERPKGGLDQGERHPLKSTWEPITRVTQDRMPYPLSLTLLHSFNSLSLTLSRLYYSCIYTPKILQREPYYLISLTSSSYSCAGAREKRVVVSIKT